MERQSLGGAEYYVLFLDDYSNKVFVYMMKNKSEVPKIFREFKNFVENQTGKRIKVLRSDNGLEYCNKELRQICIDSGIQHQTSAPYSPQQNGKAERMNRSLVEKARTMLYDANLEKTYWAEATSTAAHLLNVTPKESLNGKSPEEVFSGRKQNLKYLRVFGCIAMVMTPKELRRKWDSRSKKCVMIGYSQNSKAYKLYDPETKKVHISRNVFFIEDQMYFSKTEHASEPNSSTSAQRSQDLVRNCIDENSVEPVDDDSSSDDSSVEDEAANQQEQQDEAADDTPRRSTRIRKPVRMDDYVTYLSYINAEDPVDYSEAVNGIEKKH